MALCVSATCLLGGTLNLRHSARKNRRKLKIIFRVCVCVMCARPCVCVFAAPVRQEYLAEVTYSRSSYTYPPPPPSSSLSLYPLVITIIPPP